MQGYIYKKGTGRYDVVIKYVNISKTGTRLLIVYEIETKDVCDPLTTLS